MYPRSFASDFARFVAFAEAGRPQQAKFSQPTSGLTKDEQLKLERINLEHSITYCRKVLDLEELYLKHSKNSVKIN
jgi:hypothetical protein